MKLSKIEHDAVTGAFFDEEYWERGGGVKAGYEGIDTLIGMNRDMADEFIPIFGLKKGMKVLDLGCGAGWFVRALLDRGIDAYGIDVSEYAVKKGWELYGLKGRTIIGSIHDLGRCEDRQFDFLYSQQVFEHLPEAYCINLAKECYRIHKPGGRMWSGLVMRPSWQVPDFHYSDRDPTHFTIKYKDFWNELFCAAGYRLCPEIEIAMIEKSPTWQKLRWHQLAYLKPEEGNQAEEERE
jgi:cyclopropane fatty-acyl-phospholipid synthase-like methyltransferase